MFLFSFFHKATSANYWATVRSLLTFIRDNLLWGISHHPPQNSRHLFQWSFRVNESCLSSTVHTFFSTTSRRPACSSDHFRSGSLSWPSRSKSFGLDTVLLNAGSSNMTSDTFFYRFIILYSVFPVSPTLLTIIKFMLTCKLMADIQAYG